MTPFEVLVQEHGADADPLKSWKKYLRGQGDVPDPATDRNFREHVHTDENGKEITYQMNRRAVNDAKRGR